MENRAPEFFARVRQCGDDEGAGAEWADGLRVLIKASAGHGSIVVCGAGKMQTELITCPVIWGVSGRPRSSLLSNRSPPVRLSYKDANAPSPAPAQCLRSDGDFVSTPPEWFVSRRRARGRPAGQCPTSQNRVGQLKRGARAPRFRK